MFWKINLLVAFKIDDDRRQKVLLVYDGGKELYYIYDRLSSVKDDYNKIKRKLTNYFELNINSTFEVYNFRQSKQGDANLLISLLPDWTK